MKKFIQNNARTQPDHLDKNQDGDDAPTKEEASMIL